MHANSRDATRFNRLKRMLEDPSSILLQGSQYGTMASSIAANPTTPASYSGAPDPGYTMGGVNGIYRGHGYNSKPLLDGLAI
jgi:hypothetical protein